jgi:anti-sigma regulatory factor (Ser/Thr protein kinase)
MMTGLVDENLMKKALKTGAWNILFKPYNLTELKELLELAALLSQAIRLEQDPADDRPRSEYNLELSGADPFTPRDIERLVRTAHDCGASDDIARRRLPAAAAELLENARVHGADSLAERAYGAELNLNNDILSLVVYDDGKGFDWKRITANRGLCITGGGTPGLHLVQTLADRLSFTDQGRKAIAEFRISQ